MSEFELISPPNKFIKTKITSAFNYNSIDTSKLKNIIFKTGLAVVLKYG
jgi:hypothetical protein